MTLHKIQSDMIHRLIKGNDIRDQETVYRNNTLFILQDLLQGTFPATTALLGIDFMKSATQKFIAAHPPQSGDMNNYGADFPKFLDSLDIMKKYPYVPDVAQLEWLCHCSYLCAHHAPLTADDMDGIADPFSMSLYLQPHVLLLRSGWAVDDIWERIGKNDTDNISITPVESFIAVHRSGQKISVWNIGDGGYAFLEHLQSNPGFALAAEGALRADADLQLDLILAQAIQSNLFMKEEIK